MTVVVNKHECQTKGKNCIFLGARGNSACWVTYCFLWKLLFMLIRRWQSTILTVTTSGVGFHFPLLYFVTLQVASSTILKWLLRWSCSFVLRISNTSNWISVQVTYIPKHKKKQPEIPNVGGLIVFNQISALSSVQTTEYDLNGV